MKETTFKCDGFEVGLAVDKKDVSKLLEELYTLRLTELTNDQKTARLQQILRDVL